MKLVFCEYHNFTPWLKVKGWLTLGKSGFVAIIKNKRIGLGYEFHRHHLPFVMRHPTGVFINLWRMLITVSISKT